MEARNKFGGMISCNGVFTEAGVTLEDGTLINDGPIVEIVRKLNDRWNAKDYEGFMEALPWGMDENNNPYYDINKEDMNLLLGIMLTEFGDTVHWAILDAADYLDGTNDVGSDIINRD